MNGEVANTYLNVSRTQALTPEQKQTARNNLGLTGSSGTATLEQAGPDKLGGVKVSLASSIVISSTGHINVKLGDGLDADADGTIRVTALQSMDNYLKLASAAQTSAEKATIQAKDAARLAKLAQDAAEKASSGGGSGGLTDSQVAQKISTHNTASDAHSGKFAGKMDKPSGGTTGQYLKKTASGYEWADAPAGGGSGSGGELLTAAGTTGAYPAIALTNGWWQITITAYGGGDSGNVPDVGSMLSTGYSLAQSGTPLAPATLVLVTGRGTTRNPSTGVTAFATAFRDGGYLGWRDTRDNTTGVTRMRDFSLTILVNYSGGALFQGAGVCDTFQGWTIVAKKLS